MSDNIYLRAGRTALFGCLLLTQFQLLWMAEFHWNEEALPAPACAATVRESSQRGVPLGHEKNPCVVCQIVRQNALRPSTGTPAPRLLTAVFLRAVTLSRGLHSHQPNVANGRAPPLS